MAQLGFVIAGVQKCASSWLYLCLRDHPAIALPRKKIEEEFIGTDALSRPDAISAYVDSLCGPRETRVLGDVSVDYAANLESPRLVVDAYPDVRVILLIRHPIERALSAYWWYARRDRLPVLDSSRALERGIEAWHARPHSAAVDPWVDIIERSFYSGPVGRWKQAVGAERCLVIPYELVSCDPARVLRETCRVLSVQPLFGARVKRHPKVSVGSPALVALESRVGRTRVGAKAMDIANGLLRAVGVGRLSDVSTLNRGVVTELARLFTYDLQELDGLVRGTALERDCLSSLAAWTL